MLWSSRVNKCKELLTNPTLTFEFQTSTLKLLIYNYLSVLLIANQEVVWNYSFKESDLANRFGHELIEPQVLSKFGFSFRLLTVIMNTLSVATLLELSREKRNYLLPCIIWNFYTITAVTENSFEIIWTMYQLEVPFKHFATVFVVGTFMLSFQSKLTLQVMRFYEYLNYVD